MLQLLPKVSLLIASRANDSALDVPTNLEDKKLGHHITTSMRRSAVIACAAAGKLRNAETALQLLPPHVQTGTTHSFTHFHHMDTHLHALLVAIHPSDRVGFA